MNYNETGILEAGIKRLTEPLPSSSLKWVVKQLDKNLKWARLYPYIDQREFDDRLDECCGPFGWKYVYTETVKGGLNAELLIKIGGEWVGKSDGCGCVDAVKNMNGQTVSDHLNSVKGTYTQASRRAAMRWNVCGARYLYSVDQDDLWAQDITTQKKDGYVKTIHERKPLYIQPPSIELVVSQSAKLELEDPDEIPTKTEQISAKIPDQSLEIKNIVSQVSDHHSVVQSKSLKSLIKLLSNYKGSVGYVKKSVDIIKQWISIEDKSTENAFKVILGAFTALPESKNVDVSNLDTVGKIQGYAKAFGELK